MKGYESGYSGAEVVALLAKAKEVDAILEKISKMEESVSNTFPLDFNEDFNNDYTISL